jgi:hypothetical protein
MSSIAAASARGTVPVQVGLIGPSATPSLPSSATMRSKANKPPSSTVSFHRTGRG